MPRIDGHIIQSGKAFKAMARPHLMCSQFTIKCKTFKPLIAFKYALQMRKVNQNQRKINQLIEYLFVILLIRI